MEYQIEACHTCLGTGDFGNPGCLQQLCTSAASSTYAELLNSTGCFPGKSVGSSHTKLSWESDPNGHVYTDPYTEAAAQLGTDTSTHVHAYTCPDPNTEPGANPL